MDDEILASVTLKVSYLKPVPGQKTSRVEVEVIESDPAVSGIKANSVRVWAENDGESIGAELCRCILSLSEDFIIGWSDKAETRQREFCSGICES